MTATLAPRKTLFDVTADWLALDTLIEEFDGDLACPDVQAALATWFAELDTSDAHKLAGYVAYIRQLEMESEAAKQFAAHFTAKARTRENRMKSLKDRMKQHLTDTGRTKVTTANGDVIAVQKNGGKVPMEVDVIDVAFVPEQFVKTIRLLDNDAVRTALDGGECLDFARLLPVGTHLRIK